MRVMLTGHRYVDPKAYDGMVSLLTPLNDACNLANDHLTVISGGNLGTQTQPTGADRYWALAAYSLGIPYEIWVPYKYGENYYLNNDNMWNRFVTMLNNASHIEFIGDKNPNLPFHWHNNFIRNQAMIDTADRHVVCSPLSIDALLAQYQGGTSDAVKKMKAAKVEYLYTINPENGKWQHYKHFFEEV